MRKIYYEDQYKKEFVAEVEAIEEIDDKYHVKLNETAFFPGGGGQHDFCMDNAAFASVVMCHSVPFVCQLFAASVGGGNG